MKEKIGYDSINTGEEHEVDTRRTVQGSQSKQQCGRARRRRGALGFRTCSRQTRRPRFEVPFGPWALRNILVINMTRYHSHHSFMLIKQAVLFVLKMAK